MELKAYLTAAGSAVVAKLLASQGALEFTRAELGSGSVSSEAAARARTSLVDKAADADLVSARLSNGQAAVDVQFSNAALTADLSVSELAIYCKDPSDSASEVLYCYASFGDTPDAILRASAALYARRHVRVRPRAAVRRRLSRRVRHAGAAFRRAERAENPENHRRLRRASRRGMERQNADGLRRRRYRQRRRAGDVRPGLPRGMDRRGRILLRAGRGHAHVRLRYRSHGGADGEHRNHCVSRR